jgi:hypothetical protein
MSLFFAKPSVQKTLCYTAAYVSFAFFASLSLVIVMCLRSDLYNLCLMFFVISEITYLVYSWGLAIRIIPYIVTIGELELYFYKGAKTGDLMARVKKVLILEGSIGLGLGLGLLILAQLGFGPSF